MEQIDESQSVIYNFTTYAGSGFQNCLSNEFMGKVRALSWIQEPFAWVHGQFFKYLFRETDFLKKNLADYAESISLNFSLPFVG